jgi:hypothetical protein
MSKRVGDVWSGPAWRVESGYAHERKATAGDVVRHEQEELGNDIGTPQEMVKHLDQFHASRVVWVTATEGDAERYAYDEEGVEPKKYEIPPNSIIVGVDGDGGYLILESA